MKKGGNLNDSLQHCDGGAVVSLVVRSVRLLLQLLQLGGFQQLVLSLLVVRGAHQLQKRNRQDSVFQLILALLTILKQ